MKIKTTNLTEKEKAVLYQIIFDKIHDPSTNKEECSLYLSILKKTKCKFEELNRDVNYHFKN